MQDEKPSKELLPIAANSHNTIQENLEIRRLNLRLTQDRRTRLVLAFPPGLKPQNLIESVVIAQAKACAPTPKGVGFHRSRIQQAEKWF